MTNNSRLPKIERAAVARAQVRPRPTFELPGVDSALVVPGLALILMTLAMLSVVIYPHF